MNSNYYTPELEELHTGYSIEYEYYNEKRGGWTNDWITNIITTGKQIDRIGSKIFEGRVRVKYLDKEDILSLGWVHKGLYWYDWPIQNEIYCDPISNRCLDYRLNYAGQERYLIIEAYERNAFEWERIYAMPCKNKSQLQQLMKQLNIIR